MKKYELLRVTSTLQKHREISEIVLFLNELLDKLENRSFCKTYEFILFVYNIVLNTNYDVSFLFDKLLSIKTKNVVIQIVRQLEPNLTTEDMDKIQNDITFIQNHKEYLYISDIAWCAYIFFF